MIRAPWRVGELSGIAIRLLLGYDVFISYRWQPEVQSVVRDLAARLEALGINCFTDEREIEGGEKLPSAIKRGIRRSRIFIIFVSDSVQSSDWMPKELDCACIARRVILPVDIDDTVARLSLSAAWKPEHSKWERWSVLETQKGLKVPTLSLSEAEVADLAGRVLAIIGRRTTRVRAIRWAFSIAVTVAVVVAVSSVWAISESVRAVRITRDAQAETSRLQELGQLTNRRLAKSQGALVEVNKQKESADEARKAADRSRDASNKLADEASRRSMEAEKQAKLSLRRATDLWDRRATVAENDMAPAQVEFFLAKEVELDRSLLKVALLRYRAALARQSLVP